MCYNMLVARSFIILGKKWLWNFCMFMYDISVICILTDRQNFYRKDAPRLEVSAQKANRNSILISGLENRVFPKSDGKTE